MKSLFELLEALPDAKLQGDGSTEITSITYDSRKVEPGSLFIALRGEHFDGHHFLKEVTSLGAAALVVDHAFDGALSLPAIIVEDTRVILGALGRSFYGAPADQLLVIGITGTNGKTTSTYMLEALLSGAGLATGVIGTVEYRWPGKTKMAPNTTPDGLLLQGLLREMVNDGVEAVVMEVSSHGLATGRVDGVTFDVAVFTNLSQDHLDFHSSMKEYGAAKRRLFFEYLPQSALFKDRKPTAILNLEDHEGRQIAEELKRQFSQSLHIKTHGLSNEKTPDMVGTIVTDHVGGLEVAVTYEDKSYEVTTLMPGRFNAENLLGCLLAAHSLELPLEGLIKSMATFRGVPGRLEVVGNPGKGPAVFVDYAHTPDALHRVLQTLNQIKEGELYVLFGCGGERDRAKRPKMAAVAAEEADRVILTSDNPRREDPEAILDGIEEGLRGMKRENFSWSRITDRRKAIGDAILMAGEKDIVLIAGKGHETYQEIGTTRHDFDDRLIAGEALARRNER